MTSSAFSPDGQRIVTGSMDGTVLVWTAASPQQADLWRGYLRVLNARGQEIPGLRVTLEPDAAQ